MARRTATTPITVAQYYEMAATGALRPDARVELIEGELHWMSPIGSAHATCVDNLAVEFIEQLAGRARVRVQNPIHLDDYSEPQPDLSLARPRADRYRAGHPTPADLLLVIEVSDTTLIEDRQKKGPLYARHGIPEYWIVNLPEAQLEVYTQPQGGHYQPPIIHRAGAQIAPGAFPDLAISVADLLG